jgi:hypothetical protein
MINHLIPVTIDTGIHKKNLCGGDSPTATRAAAPGSSATDNEHLYII